MSLATGSIRTSAKAPMKRRPPASHISPNRSARSSSVASSAVPTSPVIGKPAWDWRLSSRRSG